MSRKTKKLKSSPLADFIKPVVDKKYRTRSEAAEDIGIDESILSRICSGKRPGVSEGIIEGICGKLGLDKKEGVIKLFLTNHFKIRKFLTPPKKPVSFKIIHPNPDDKEINPKKLSKAYTPVPIVPINDLTKTISLFHTAKEHVLVSNALADKEKNIKCCRVKGDSMAPTLINGSIIAVNLEDRIPQHNKLFLLNWKNEIIVRRVLIKDKYLLFCSDNPSQDKIEVCSIKEGSFDKKNIILGKVIWSMGKV